MGGSVSGSFAATAAAASVAYDEVQAIDGAVWWLESRPNDGGRVTLMKLAPTGLVTEVTPPEASVGSDLHGYGGGSYAVHASGIWYVDAVDGHLWSAEHGGRRRPVVERQSDEEHLGDLTVGDGSLWLVRERPDGDELVEVRLDGTQQVFASYEGFFGSPRPNGDRLAWLRWDADRMPWDGAEVLVADRGGTMAEALRVSGGRGESAGQPLWGRDGHLWFVSDRTGWWNVYSWSGTEVVAAASMSLDVAPPEWEAAYRSFLPLPSGELAMITYGGPDGRLAIQRESGLLPAATAYTSFKPCLAVNGSDLIGVAASPTQAPHIFALDWRQLGPSRVLAESGVAAPPQLSIPELHHVPTDHGKTVTALVYPPTGLGKNWKAPLVVRAHPGPTASMKYRLDWHVQFLTTNGFAVVDVDYRGSAGYGRDYRRSLYGQWGTADVEDCVTVAEYLLDAERTRLGQVFVTGASAGAYTALQAVSRPSIFAGAVARSAIVDPFRWSETAPRWQRPHALALLGSAGAVRADGITRPVLLIHGSGDHVAPVSDVAELARGLRERGMPCDLLLLDARHELAAHDVIMRAWQAELSFYRRVLSS